MSYVIVITFLDIHGALQYRVNVKILGKSLEAAATTTNRAASTGRFYDLIFHYFRCPLLERLELVLCARVSNTPELAIYLL